ncbi:interleukin-18 receptor 1-like [Lissotriton helveticus]
MKTAGLAVFLLTFLRGPLTGVTDYTPSTCVLDGEHTLLKCSPFSSTNPQNSQNNNYTVKWFRISGHDESMSQILETNRRLVFNGQALEFWPAEVSDTGKYLCVYGNNLHNASDTQKSLEILEAIKDQCFTPICLFEQYARIGQSAIVACGMDQNKNRNYSVKWYKDCLLYKENELKLTFKELKDRDAGNYTCIIKFLYNGKEFNYSRTTNLKLQASVEVLKPGIVSDSSTQVVEIGKAKILSCTAFVGSPDKESANSLYWLGKNLRDNEDLFFMDPCQNASEIPCEMRVTSNFSGGNEYLTRKLKFHAVKVEDLEYSYVCKLDSTTYNQNITFTLIKREQPLDIPKHAFNTGMILIILSSAVFLVFGAACFTFRIDIILLFRTLTGRDETLAGIEGLDF